MVANLRRGWNVYRSLRILSIAVGLMAVAHEAEASWRILNYQSNSSPDFEYEVRIYEIVNGVAQEITRQPYSYRGMLDGSYVWKCDYSLFGKESTDTIWCRVYNSWMGGDWMETDQFYAEWEED